MIESFVFDNFNARSLVTRLEVFDYKDQCIGDGQDDEILAQILRIERISTYRLLTAFRALR